MTTPSGHRPTLKPDRTPTPPAARCPLGTAEEVADYLGVPVATLYAWRCRGGKGPKSSKVGKHLRYRWADVETWLDDEAGVNNHQACPYCTGAPQFLRSELGAHIRQKHTRVLAALAVGSLDEQLRGGCCDCPHEMEA